MIIDSPIVSGSFLSTGSLSQIGNAQITGSLTVSGSAISLVDGSYSGSGANLFGIPAAGITGLNLSQISSGSVSASISPNLGLLINTSVSASNFTGSFTGSLTGIATSASYAAFALTSSYSLGGSGFPFSGSAVITGSLLVSGSQVITGSLAISTLSTGSGVRYVIADADGLISAQTASAVIFTTQQAIATSGQTVFPITNGYSTGYVTVFVNGSKLNEDEFTDTSGTNIVFATGSMVNDVVEFQKYLPASGVSNNTLRTTNYFTTTLGQTNFTVNYTPGLLDVFYNGSKLSNTEYTAANGTSILLATGSNAGDTVEVDVYSYQVGAFSGIGGSGVARELAFYNTSNSITGSNKVTYDGSTFSVTGSFLVTGSSTFTNIGPAIFSGSVTAVGGFSGSFSGNADSASLAANSLLLQGTGSVGFTTTASFLAVSASQQQLSSSYIALSASYNVASSSFSTRITSDSSSISSRTTQVERTYATTGSNTFTGVQNFSNTCTPNGFNSGASLYTAGGLQVTQDTYFSSSVYIKGNVTVYGTQSVSYVSSSQFNIGTNIITVNTFTPSVRFGGLSVFDSGSTGLTGSIFWDSELNRWIYTNASGSGGGATYGGGMFISGPRNTQGLGCEQGTTACMLLVGQGGDHMTSSMIYHDSAVTCIGSNASITSTGAACFAGNVCVGGGLVAQQASTFCNTVGLFGASPQLYIGATNGASDYTILKWCTTDKSLNIHNQSTGGNPQLVIACNGNVGVKTIAAPNYDLEVRGNIGVVSSTSAGLITTSTLCAAGTVTGFVRFDGLHTPSLTTYTGPSINACKDDANYTTSLVFKTTDGSGINNTNLRITGAGISCFAGTVCVPTLYANNCINIGTTTSLGSRLSIQSANDQAGITMFNTFDCNKWSLRTGTTGISNKGFGIVDDICNLTRIQIDGAGNVGIGTLSPSGKLQISNSSTQYAVYTSGGNLELYSPEGNLGYVRLGSAYNLNGIYGSCGLNYIVTGTSSHVFNTTDNNTERFRIFNTGIACFACQVCAPKFIATQLSGTCLTLNAFSSGNGFKMDYGSASGEITAINLIANGTTNGFIGIQMVDGSNGDLWLGGSSNRSMTIYRTGNTGFNTNTPCTRVHSEGGYGSRWGGNGCFYGGGISGGGMPYGDIYGNGASYTYQTCCGNANNSSLYGGFAAGYFKGGPGSAYGGGGAGIVAIGGDGGNAESVNAGGGAGIFARGGKNGAGSVHSYAAWFDGGDVVIRCGKFGINTCYPTAMFEAGKVCENTTAGGFLFDTKSVADSNWFCFFQPTSNWAGLMTMNWVAPNDFNRSGAAQVRWSYQNCSAALGPTTSIFNDSQNATATFRYAGGYLQACITGAGAGYNVQFTILGARGS